jgi:drug/metabolite transporter (DMT)-like permease
MLSRITFEECRQFFRLITLVGSGADFAKTRMVLGAVMISFSGVWVKVSHVTPTASAFYRVLFGGLFLLIGAAYKGEMKRFGGRWWLPGLLCGLFFALDLICYHTSIRHVGPGLGTILPNFQVFILAAVGALFLKERLGLGALFSMPFAVAGLFMIVGVNWQNLDVVYRLGIYAGLAAAVFYSLFLLTLRKLQSDQVGKSVYYVLMAVSLITAGLLGLEILRAGDTFRIPDMQSFWALTALGLFSQAVGWILITNALPHVRAALSGLILLLQPALAFVWDVLFFNRPTGPLNWIGVGVVLVAIYLGATRQAAAKRG